MALVLALCALAAAQDTIQLTGLTPFTLPLDSNNNTLRTAGINQKRAGFQYGPDIIAEGNPDVQANGTFYPTGVYADQIITTASGEFFPEAGAWEQTVTAAANATILKLQAEEGGTTFKTLDDFQKIYTENFFQEAIPGGPFQGELSNGTSDLLFAMERLSASPYSVRRVGTDEYLSFEVDDTTAEAISTMTQSQLQSAGRLFYADYRDMSSLKFQAGRYGPASDAYFFLHPTKNQFLPLAIRPNNGSPLFYTPVDSANDWMYAKMGFNLNSQWYDAWVHLVTTHEVIDVVYEAAVRTFSDDHPVYAILTRMAYQCFVIRRAAVANLLNKGGPIDALFPWSGSQAIVYTNQVVANGYARWKSNYWETLFQNRGLINTQPALPHFPFYEDVKIITTAQKQTLTTFVNSYYTSDSMVAQDGELQAFIAEGTPANIQDWFTSMTTRSDLVDFLAQFAYTVSILHATLNTGDPVSSTSVLPFHPTSFYQPPPQEKGITDLIPYMPNIAQAAGQVKVLGSFARPYFRNSNRTIAEMFDDPLILPRLNQQTRDANTLYKSQMDQFSSVVRGRTFDSDGLSQGMPFIWTVLDPQQAAFYVTI